MGAKDLSILIPARNEIFLALTIEDILKNIEADTEVIAVLDGEWADPPIPQHERVNVIKLTKNIGQRAATNLACKLSRAKYIMKVDAHCAFDKGFDRKMLEKFKITGDKVTMVPIMRNLWAFDWKCLKCGKKWYQGPTPTECQEKNYKGTGVPCDSKKFQRKMIWIGKHNPQSTSYCFDSSPKFTYFEDWKHRPQYEKDKKEKGLTETMSLQGSCWMLTRDKYWELNVCDENFGSWGSQGIEVAVKTWLSGGQVLVNHNTWYAHMFRTQGGDFGFPYEISNKDQRKAQDRARDLFFNNKWPKQIRPLSWLVEKFWPVKGWIDEDLAKLKEKEKEFKHIDKTIQSIKPKEKIITPATNEKLNLTDFELDSEEVKKPNNLIQIREGNRLILLDVAGRTKSDVNNILPSHGTIYSIEPSNNVIYYSDEEINLKILIKKSQ
jgi:glycosyltransferase involved in cell wall biosynthesis